jgi:alkanesulfonate monooxygenase SsuD/methylene tetrahydromethanopterin reductase-like flavin-dependent oxidoreductase (luciferase family)
VGAWTHPLESAGARPNRLSGTAAEIADRIRSFREAGFTRVELMYLPATMEALDALAPVVEALKAD